MMIEFKTVCQQRKALDSRKISVRELTEEYFGNIRKRDSEIGAYITLCEGRAYEQADAAQKLIDSGEAAPLTGIPFAVKDNICTKGIRTTCGSKMLEDFVPPYDAAVIERLCEQRAVMIGKTNMDEFGMGGSTQTSAFVKTRNPYDTERVPGGSSGGSAAAVAAELCAAALGSDTGGSVRQPAAFCGVTGLKPTYGSVSRYGLIAFASSFDQIGPIAHTAEDCGLILRQISGYDKRDGTSSAYDMSATEPAFGRALAGMKLALPTEFFGEGIDTEVREHVYAAAKLYKQMGAELIECSMPSLRYAVAAYYLISSAEAASNLSRYDGIKYGHRAADAESYEQLVRRSRSEGFGDEVKRRILLGNYALSSGYYDEYYRKAMALRQLICAEYDDIFSRCDAVITPTAPTSAYRPDERINDPVRMYRADICTVPVSIAGLPAVSTTCGYDRDGMPIGMSIVGRKFGEPTIIAIADAYEKQFSPRAPKL